MHTSPPETGARTAYGIDENAGSPIVVKALGRGIRLRFIPGRLEEAKVPPPGAITAACMFQKESFTRWLTAPIASARKAGTVFHSLLDIQLPFSVEECEVALLAMTPTPDRAGTRGLMAGARGSDIAKRLETLAAAGLDPQVLDQEGIALWTQSIAELPPTHDDTARVVIYAGLDRCTLSLGLGREFMAAQAMRQVDADTIQRLLKSVFQEMPPRTEWVWTGPGSADEETVRTGHAILSARWRGTLVIARDPRAFLARALAARALTAGPARCNLRTGPFLHPMLAKRQARRPYHLAATCLAAGLALCLVNLGWSLASQHRLTAGQQAIRQLAVQISGSPRGLPPGQEHLAVKRIMEARQRDMEPFLAAVDEPLPGTLAGILALAHEEGVSIETLTLGRQSGVLHGFAPKYAQGEALAGRLEAGGWTTTIERKEQAPAEERVAFVIGMGQPHEKK